jgi:hypothetical protein
LRFSQETDNIERDAAHLHCVHDTAHPDRDDHLRLVDNRCPLATSSDIAVDFSSAGGAVRMVVTLDVMHDEAFTRMQKDGFTSQLTKLDERFGK